MKISFKALTKFLVKHNHRFIIENSPEEEFQDRCVLKFVVAYSYPVGPFSYIGTGEEVSACQADRIQSKGGRIMLHFDMDNEKILSCCTLLYTQLKELKLETITQMNKDKNVCNSNQISSAKNTLPC